MVPYWASCRAPHRGRSHELHSLLPQCGTRGALAEKAAGRAPGRPDAWGEGDEVSTCMRGKQLAECLADLVCGLKRADDELFVAHEALEGLESAQDGVPLPPEACCLES